MVLVQLFLEFCRVGLFSVGGGLATIPFLTDLGERTGWFTSGQLADMIAISESTPGPMGVNMATYVGYVTGGSVGGVPAAVLGAAVATLGLVTPSIIIILIIASFLKSFRNNRYVDSAFYGLRPASTGLISAAGLSVVAANLFDMESLSGGFGLGFFNVKGIILAVILWVLTNKVKQTKKLHPIIFILASAVVGIVLGM